MLTMATLKRLWQASAPLTATGCVMLAGFAVALAAMAVDHRTVLGAPTWLKPAKFAISTAIYAFTLAWIFTFLPERRRLTSRVGWITAVVLVFEVGVIAVQAGRGVTSHFNVGTPIDAALFSTMGLAIVVAWGAAIALTVALFRQRFTDRAFGWALRLGMLLTVVGQATGGLMTNPTSAQLAEARRTRITIAGAHTVGGPDGGPGVPITGWSREHGDLRVPHFVGMHAVQILPALAWLLIPVGSVDARESRHRDGGRLCRAVRGSAAPGDERTPAGSDGVAMTIEGVFSACNLLAVAGWILLLAVPGHRLAMRIAGTVIPLTLAAVYLTVFVLHARGSNGGFSSLAAVAQLFENRWLLLAGWVHYLAFDLFIGAWETRDAMARRVPRLLLAPCLVMTFMLGPIGLLCYHVLRARSHQPLDGAVLAPVTKTD